MASARLISTALGFLACLQSSTVSKTARPSPIASRVDIILDRGTARLAAREASLADLARALNRDLHVNFLIDTPPRSDRVNLDVEGATVDIIAAICDKFDLVSQQKANLFMLHQRFRQMNTRPQFNLPELRATSRDLLKVLRGISPTLSSANVSKRFSLLANSLTPDQIARLKNKQAVQLSELRAEQIENLQLCLLDQYLGKQEHALAVLSDQLNRLRSSYFQIRESPTFYRKRAGKPAGSRPQVAPKWHLTWVTPLLSGFEHLVMIPIPPPPGGLAELADTEQHDRMDPDAVLREDADIDVVDFRAQGREAGSANKPRAVSLALGHTNVQSVAARLSAGAGMRIDATPDVADRHVLVYVTEYDFLALAAMLAELNGWVYRDKGNDRFEVARGAVKRPSSIEEIPAAMQRCLHPELLRFLGIGVQADELPVITDPNLLNYLQNFKRSAIYARHHSVAAATARCGVFEQSECDVLKRLVSAKLYDGQRVPYSSLDASMRESLISMLALQAIGGMNHMDADYLTGDLAPFQRDIRRAEITLLSENSVEVGMSWEQGGRRMRRGFGSGLDEGPNPFKSPRSP